MRVRITFGGSHRKNRRCVEALKPYLTGSSIMPAALYSKRLQTIVTDSPEMRETLKRIGGSISRRQEAWINQP